MAFLWFEDLDIACNGIVPGPAVLLLLAIFNTPPPPSNLVAIRCTNFNITACDPRFFNSICIVNGFVEYTRVLQRIRNVGDLGVGPVYAIRTLL